MEENDEVAVRTLFKSEHIGPWGGISPTLRETVVKGFRHFKVGYEKIVAHWALLDGEALQNSLTATNNACEVTKQD